MTSVPAAATQARRLRSERARPSCPCAWPPAIAGNGAGLVINRCLADRHAWAGLRLLPSGRSNPRSPRLISERSVGRPMVKLNPFPEEGELVVGTVREVQNFGAFVTLEEYPGKEGFVHIREVAPGWVKRIRDYVREKQRVVCKVMGVDAKKGHVDLSIKATNDHQKRETIQAWKNEQKADKFLEMLAEREKTTAPQLLDLYGRNLIESFGSLYAAFQQAAEYGKEAFDQEGLKGPWVDGFIAFSKENIQQQFVDIAGYVDVQSTAPDGLKHI